MTAEELISGLRERGYTVHRSHGPGWVIIPRLKPQDAICEFLSSRGAKLREYQPQRWSAPEDRAYEAVLSSVEVDVPPREGEDKHMLRARKQLSIWEAAGV